MYKKIFSNLITILLLCSCNDFSKIKSLKNNQYLNLYDKTEISSEEYFECSSESISDCVTSIYDIEKNEEKDYLNLLSDMGYSIFSQQFKDINIDKQKNIIINYPKIIGFNEKSIEDRINRIIQDAAMEKYYYFLDWNNKLNSNFDNTEWPVEYSIKFFNKNLISIMFQGYIYTKGSAHGVDVVYTVNINLNTGKKISINELFYDSFIDKICHKYVKGIDIETFYADETTINETYDYYKKDFDNSYDNFYFSKNNFIIILPIRNYFRFAINYKDLEDCIKYDNPIWNDFIL